MEQSKDKQVCIKCKELHYCDEHHILPKGIFGFGRTVYLCKNCHHEFHNFLGFKYLRKANAQPAEFYINKFALWIATAIAVGFFVCLTSAA